MPIKVALPESNPARHEEGESFSVEDEHLFVYGRGPETQDNKVTIAVYAPHRWTSAVVEPAASAGRQAT